MAAARTCCGRLHEEGCKVPIVIYEPSGAVSQAHDLTQRGAFQYVAHPVKPEDLCELLAVAIRHHGWTIERKTHRNQPALRPIAGATCSSAPAARCGKLPKLSNWSATARSTVLITGETGTGKEMAARALHMASSRSASRMVAVNCAALPDHLLEAELFGHTKGAFTGAVNARVGLFEQAHRGTIFLDEIGEMPLPLQAKLLRVLQEREIQRIGSSEPVPIDVRVIAASNVNLA